MPRNRTTQPEGRSSPSAFSEFRIADKEFPARRVRRLASSCESQVSLSNIYSNLGETERAEEFAKKAFEHRRNVSVRESLYIAYQFHDVVSGDQPRAIETLEVWKQSFPREFQPVNSLAFTHTLLGDFERAVSEGQEAVRRNPAHGFPYSNLAFAYRGLGRFDNARATAERAVALKVETVPTRLLLYQLSLVSGDQDSAAKHLQRLRDNPREFQTLGARAQVATWSGRVSEARELYEEAFRFAERRNLPHAATGYLVSATLMEMAYGNRDNARSGARRILARKSRHEHRLAAALALAASGSDAEAETISAALTKEHPQHTIINSILAPLIRAGAELARKNPDRAIERLRVTTQYEIGFAAALVPIYLRGQSYLMRRSGSSAVAEFQRMLAHRGTDPFSPFHALAPLGLARAFAIAGDTESSAQAYEKFLAGWSSADANVPVLLAARQEYDRLKRAAAKR